MKVGDILYLFLKLNIWLCLTSSLMVVATAVALSIPLSAVGVGALLPPLLFYFIYVEDRRTVSDEDWINQPRRSRLVQQYGDELLITEIVALVVYELLLVGLVLFRAGMGLEAVLFGQLPLLVLAVYGRLKRYPSFDSTAVGATWSFVTVFAVLVSTGHPVNQTVVAVFVAWFVIVFAGVESRNLNDIEGDTESDKTTLAGYLGERPTKVMEGLLKIIGVAIFWQLSSVLVASIVVVYLVSLRCFRFATQRVELTAAGRRRPIFSWVHRENE